MRSNYTYQIDYSKFAEVTGIWVNCSFKTTNCAIIPHLKALQLQEDNGKVRNISASAISNLIG